MHEPVCYELRRHFYWHQSSLNCTAVHVFGAKSGVPGSKPPPACRDASTSSSSSSSGDSELLSSYRVTFSPARVTLQSSCADCLLGFGAQSVVVEEFRAPGAQEQERFGAEADLWDDCQVMAHFDLQVRQAWYCRKACTGGLMTCVRHGCKLQLYSTLFIPVHKHPLFAGMHALSACTGMYACTYCLYHPAHNHLVVVQNRHRLQTTRGYAPWLMDCRCCLLLSTSCQM